MSDAQNTMNGNLADSIAMLEQILEVMPQDVDALKAVYKANLQGGQNNKAFEYLGLLVDLAIEGETSLLAFVGEELPQFEDDRPNEVAAQIARLRAMGGPEGDALASDAQTGAKAGEVAKPEADIAEELALAWRLYEEDQLSQEEYSSVLHDLTEVSSKELEVPISVLHVLNDRGFTQMNRIMNYMANRSNVPCLSLAGFELAEGLATVLPLQIPAHDGALPFGFFGNDLLVAVLNPFNNVLVDKVERVSGHRCHTFLVEPEEYDLVLGKLRALAAAA